MASPRIFVSSTCYDLHEIRTGLREFMQSFEYEPVMSDFGDIFYDFNKHVQDSCIKEIEKSQMYVLIIGNNYGSTYHKDIKEKALPDSVTLKEFKESLSYNIPKIVFINRFVNYDYNNYKRVLTEKLKSYYEENSVADDKIEEVNNKIRTKLDQSYNFPNSSYPFIFRFIDVVVSQTKNNAFFEFETIDDIKSSLRKQWAGYMYEKLTEEKEDTITQHENIVLLELKDKLGILERIIRELGSKVSDDKGSVSFSIKEIEEAVVSSQITDARKLLDESLYNIMYDIDWNNDEISRFEFKQKITQEAIDEWLKSLDQKISIYKWSNTIDIQILFDNIEIEYYSNYADVPIESVIKLNALFKSLSHEEVNNVELAILSKLKKVEKISENNNDEGFSDDIPF